MTKPLVNSFAFTLAFIVFPTKRTTENNRVVHKALVCFFNFKRYPLSGCFKSTRISLQKLNRPFFFIGSNKTFQIIKGGKYLDPISKLEVRDSTRSGQLVEEDDAMTAYVLTTRGFAHAQYNYRTCSAKIFHPACSRTNRHCVFYLIKQLLTKSISYNI